MSSDQIEQLRADIESLEKQQEEAEKEIERLNMARQHNREQLMKTSNHFVEEEFIKASMEVLDTFDWATAKVEELLTILNEEGERTAYFRKKAEELEKKLEETRGVTLALPTCQICRFAFSDHPDRVPRLLGCGHSLCHECATNLLDGTVLKCPFDRKDTVLELGIVSALPKNYTVVEMIDALKERKD